MKGTYLGEFEEVVLLTIGILDGNAYGVSVQKELADQLGRSVTLSALHTAMHRMEKKGFLESKLGDATKERGGKRKRLFYVTGLGREALIAARSTREKLWQAMPALSTQNPEQ